MGRVASSVDNTMIESFWSTMQPELLDRQTWTTEPTSARAIFEWIEGDPPNGAATERRRIPIRPLARQWKEPRHSRPQDRQDEAGVGSRDR
jgi:hypothetical protein